MVDALAAALAPELARRVVALLGEGLADAVVARLGGDVRAGGLTGVTRPAPTPLTAREVMARLGRSYDFVRDHRHELGVLAVKGARPRLLFDAEAVDRFARAAADGATAATQRRRSSGAGSPTGTGKTRRRRPARLGTDVPLLPVRGRSEAA